MRSTSPSPIKDTRLIRILHLEDVKDDADLVVRMLRAEGLHCEVVHVETREAFAAALAAHRFDLVLSDYKLPSFDGLAALDLLQEMGIDVPFVLVTGTIGEERAAEAMRRGVTEFVLKDRLRLLVPAVRRALEAAAERRARREAEESLRESQRRYREMVEGASDLIYRTDADGRFTHLNAAVVNVLGRRAEDLLGRQSLELVRPDARAAFRAFYQRQRDERIPSTYYEVPILTSDGGERWLGQNIRIVLGDGEIVAWEAIARDITDRKRVQGELESERRLLRTILDGVDAGIIACDAAGAPTLFNRAAREWLAIPGDSAPIDWARDDALLQAVLRSLGGEEVRNVEMTLAPAGKPMRRVLSSGRPILDEAGRPLGAVLAFGDITDLRRAQEEIRLQREALYQSEKLACMGTLLAGVAHELNNPLSVVLGNASLLLRQVDAGGPVAVRVQNIEKAADRCARIVGNFLALARQRPPERKKASLNQIVQDAHGARTIRKPFTVDDLRRIVAEALNGSPRSGDEPGRTSGALA